MAPIIMHDTEKIDANAGFLDFKLLLIIMPSFRRQTGMVESLCVVRYMYTEINAGSKVF